MINNSSNILSSPTPVDKNNKAGYKHTTLGLIPGDWEINLLRNLSDIQQGISKGKLVKEEVAISVPYLRVANVKDGYFDLSEIKEIIIHKAEKEKFLLKDNDLLITEGGDPDKLGRGAKWTNQIKECIYQNHLFRIRTDASKLDPDFFFNFLQGQRAKLYFLSCAKQTTGIASINSSQVKELPVVTPGLCEQRIIAAILATWNEAITKTQQLIAQLQLRNKGLMQQLFKPKRGWNNIYLGNVLAKITNGITYDAELNIGKPVTRIETISKGEIDFSRVGYCSDKNINSYKLKKGDILYSHINSLEHIGKIAFFDSERELYHGMNLLLLRTNEIASSKFLYYWLKSDYGKKQSKSFAKKAVNQASISSTEVKSFRISIPDLEMQNEIVEYLDQAVEEENLCKKKLSVLQQQKKGLMQKLLTGEVRVKITK